MLTAKEREQMNAEHRAKFESVAQAMGINALKALVLAVADKETLAQAYAEEIHLNRIPLIRWDNMDWAVRQLVGHAPKGSWPKNWFNDTDQRVWSLSDSVCTLKHVAIVHILKAERV